MKALYLRSKTLNAQRKRVTENTLVTMRMGSFISIRSVELRGYWFMSCFITFSDRYWMTNLEISPTQRQINLQERPDWTGAITGKKHKFCVWSNSFSRLLTKNRSKFFRVLLTKSKQDAKQRPSSRFNFS